MRCIGRYEICGFLGRGGMSIIYKAYAPVTRRVVALKILSPRDDMLNELVGWDKLRKGFEKEAQLMGSIRHPHVAAILDYDFHESQPFFVMEFFVHSLGSVIGETYKVEEPSRVLSVEKAVKYTRQTLLGLSRLHYAGLIHRDIKPFNILLTEEDAVKLIDFGLSRKRGEIREQRPKGIHVGSPFYAAPEQEKDPDGVDGRADLFSIGVSLYRMVTGRIPDPGTGDMGPASKYHPDLDEHWDRFMYKAMALPPEERFVSAEDMLDSLDELYTHWKKKKEKACRLLADEDTSPRTLPVESWKKLRTKPVKVGYKQGRKEFGLDALWRPRQIVSNDFRQRQQGVVYDASTKLNWQARGSRFSMTWKEAWEYVDHLNATRLYQKDNWRLPTVEELLSIFNPLLLKEDFCLDSLFDADLRWIWSADRCTFTSAWVADVGLGYITRQDMSGLARVCAVSSEN